MVSSTSGLKASMPLITSGIPSPDARAGSAAVPDYDTYGTLRVPQGRSDSPSLRVLPACESPAGTAAVPSGTRRPLWTLAAKYGVWNTPNNSVEVPAYQPDTMTPLIVNTASQQEEAPTWTESGIEATQLEVSYPSDELRKPIDPPAPSARVLGVIPMKGTKKLGPSVELPAGPTMMTPPPATLPPAASYSAPAATPGTLLMGSLRSMSPVPLPRSLETAIAPKPRTVDTAIAQRSVPIAMVPITPMVNTAPAYMVAASPTLLPPVAPREPEFEEPRTVQTVWDGHFDAFLRRDLARLLSDYDESSHIRLFNDADGTKIDCIGVSRIAQLYGELMAELLEKQPEASVVDVDELAGSVFFVWRCPVAGVLAATSTYIFAHTMKIWRQNMVLTKVPRNVSPRKAS